MTKRAIAVVCLLGLAANVSVARSDAVEKPTVELRPRQCFKPEASEGPGLYLAFNVLNNSKRTVVYDLDESDSLPLVHQLSVDVEIPTGEGAATWKSRAIAIGSYLGPSGRLAIRPENSLVLMVYLERAVVREVISGEKRRVALEDTKGHKTFSLPLDFADLPGCTLD